MPGTPEIAGAAVVLGLSVASACCYRRDHRARRFAAAERTAMASPGEFRAVCAFLRYSVLIAGLGSLLAPHAVWLAGRQGPAQVYAGIAVALAGFALFAMARRALGEHYSPCYESYLPEAVVERGPYAHVRHPIYTANLITVLGLSITTGSAWLLLGLVVLAHYYARSALREEAALVQAHPGYEDYRRRTGRFFPALRRSASVAIG